MARREVYREIRREAIVEIIEGSGGYTDVRSIAKRLAMMGIVASRMAVSRDLQRMGYRLEWVKRDIVTQEPDGE